QDPVVARSSQVGGEERTSVPYLDHESIPIPSPVLRLHGSGSVVGAAIPWAYREIARVCISADPYAAVGNPGAGGDVVARAADDYRGLRCWTVDEDIRASM